MVQALDVCRKPLQPLCDIEPAQLQLRPPGEIDPPTERHLGRDRAQLKAFAGPAANILRAVLKTQCRNRFGPKVNASRSRKGGLTRDHKHVVRQDAAFCGGEAREQRAFSSAALAEDRPGTVARYGGTAVEGQMAVPPGKNRAYRPQEGVNQPPVVWTGTRGEDDRAPPPVEPRVLAAAEADDRDVAAELRPVRAVRGRLMGEADERPSRSLDWDQEALCGEADDLQSVGPFGSLWVAHPWYHRA